MKRVRDWFRRTPKREEETGSVPSLSMGEVSVPMRALAAPLGIPLSVLSPRQILVQELLTDPLSRGYDAMTDTEVVTDLNTLYRERAKALMTASEVMQTINIIEFTSKTSEQQGLIWNVLHIGVINPFGVEKDLFVSVFGSGSLTITALKLARVDAITRAVELGLGVVRPGHVGKARA